MHIHFHNDTDCKLSQILKNQELIMATQEQFQAQLDRIQASIDKLTANAGGLNASQEDTALANLTSKADALEQLANTAPQP